jgi:hypothetical protein
MKREQYSASAGDVLVLRQGYVYMFLGGDAWLCYDGDVQSVPGWRGLFEEWVQQKTARVVL